MPASFPGSEERSKVRVQSRHGISNRHSIETKKHQWVQLGAGTIQRYHHDGGWHNRNIIIGFIDIENDK